MKRYLKDIFGKAPDPRPQNRADVAKRYRITTNGNLYRIEHLFTISPARWAAKGKEEWVPVTDGFTNPRFVKDKMERSIDLDWSEYTEWKPVE